MSIPRSLERILKSARRTPRTRTAHMYCLGMPQSGTHAIAAMFSRCLRSAHEPQSEALLELILDLLAGRITESEVRELLLRRDRRLNLEIDCSQLNFLLLNELVELFPQAKFILTLRHPSTWLDAVMNDRLTRRASARWDRLDALRYRPDLYAHPPQESLLRELGLFTLDGYLAAWELHNRIVIKTVPAQRLLVCRPDEIDARSAEIAAFAGVRTDELGPAQTSSATRAVRFNVLDQLDAKYLQAKIEEHCGALVAEFFRDTKPRRSAASRPLESVDSSIVLQGT